MSFAARARSNGRLRSGVVIVVSLALFALLGPFVARWAPEASDFDLLRDPLGPPGPSAQHWLGVDHLFRDVFSRLAQGARTSLAVSLSAAVLTTAIGLGVGVAAGMTEGTGWRVVDTVLMRLVDVMLALPFLLFVTAIGVAVGRTDVGTVLLVLGLVGWTATARVVRAETYRIRDLDFVLASRALGAGGLRVVVAHVLPNLAGIVIVVATTSVAHMILAEAVLGYLTVGIQPPAPSWGRMLHEAEPMLSTRLALAALPGSAIVLAVLGWNRVGEGLAEVLKAEVHPARRRVPVDLLLAAAALLLFSVARPKDVAPPIGSRRPAASPERGGVFRGASFVNIRTLDPAIAFDEASRPLLQLAFARLVTWDTAGRIAPDLAESWDVSPDGCTLTFTLRANARFHDGEPVLARDVKRSFERLLHPRTPTPAASFYGSIAGFSAYRKGGSSELSGVRVIGDRVVAFDLTEPDATFLPKLTLGFAAPVCASMGASADARDLLPCGAGPLRVISWEPDKGVRLVRHEGYYASERSYLDALEWLVSVPVTTQRYKFERGELDYVSDLSSADRDRYLASSAWRGLGRWRVHAQTNGVFLNTELPPFDRRDVRRAVAFALDPASAVRMRNDVVEADRMIPPSVPGPSRDEPMRRHDLGAALASMARAGLSFDPSTGRGGWATAIPYLTIADTGDQQFAEIWQQQLARIGLRVELKLVTYASYLAESGRRRTATMGRAGWSADYPDPSNFFEPTLSSAAIEDEGSENKAFFSSPELDAILKRAHVTEDRRQRDALYLRAEAIVRDEAPWVPTHNTQSYELWQPYVHGYERHPVLGQRFDDVWIDVPAQSPLARGARARGPIGGPR